LAAPSKQMLNYKLSITTQSFLNILYCLKKEATLPTTGTERPGGTEKIIHFQ